MFSFPLVISWIRLFDMSFAEKCCDFLISSALSAEPPKSWPQRWQASFWWVFFLLVFHCGECRKQVNYISWPTCHGVCRLDSGKRKMKHKGRADNLRKARDRAVSIPCSGSLPEGSPRQEWIRQIYLMLTVVPIFSFTVYPLVWRFTALYDPLLLNGSNSGSLGALHHCSQVACTLSLLNSILCLLDPNL